MKSHYKWWWNILYNKSYSRKSCKNLGSDFRLLKVNLICERLGHTTIFLSLSADWFHRKHIGSRKKHALSWLRSLCFGGMPIKLSRQGKVFIDACNPFSSLSLHYLSTYFSAFKVYINVTLKPSHVQLRVNESSIAPRSSF